MSGWQYTNLCYIIDATCRGNPPRKIKMRGEMCESLAEQLNNWTVFLQVFVSLDVVQ